MLTAQNIAFWGFMFASIIILGFAALVLWKVYNGDISLVGLIAEPSQAGADGKPKASLARFQFLLFTFVVAGLFLLLSIEAGTFVDIPNNVLALIGISGGSFLISKGVNASKDAEPEKPQTKKRTTKTDPET
jgi:hypothetical protein